MKPWQFLMIVLMLANIVAMQAAHSGNLVVIIIDLIWVIIFVIVAIAHFLEEFFLDKGGGE